MKRFTHHIRRFSHLSLTNKGIFNGKWITSYGKETINSINPFTGEVNANVSVGTVDDYKLTIQEMYKTKEEWMNTPAPLRGEIVRKISQELRNNKEKLANLISLETGKIKTESLGEVQEAIDICDFLSDCHVH